MIKSVSDNVTSSSETLEPENTFEGVLTLDVSTQTCIVFLVTRRIRSPRL